MAGNAKQFCADIVGPADRGEPSRSASQNIRRHRNRLDIVDGGWAAVEPDIGREWRLQSRLALLAFEALQQCGFFAANIGAGAMSDIDVERPAVEVVFADQLG